MKSIVGELRVASAAALAALLAVGCSAESGADAAGRYPAPVQGPAAAAQPAVSPTAVAESPAPEGLVAPGTEIVSAAPEAAGFAPVGKRDPAAAAAVSRDQVVARLGDKPITMAQLMAPLIESHGLNTLLALVQFDLARQSAADVGATVIEEDFVAERKRTLDKLFEESDEKIDRRIELAKRVGKPEEVAALQQEKQGEHAQLLEQFLTQKNITPMEFDLVLKTNTYLRKHCEVRSRGQVTEQMLRNEFGVQFEEKLQGRHIQLDALPDAWEAKRRLAAGEPFEKVATEMSKNQTSRALGGQMPPFSRKDSRFPQTFKDVAFALADGQVSDIVEAGAAWHIVKAEKRIFPKAVTFEQQRDILQKQLEERLITLMVRQLRENIGDAARQKLKIEEPVLQAQFDGRLKKAESEAEAKQKAQADWEKQRDEHNARFNAAKAATRPATGPATGPATAPASGVGAAPEFGPAAPPPPVAPATAPAAAPATAPVSAPAAAR